MRVLLIICRMVGHKYKYYKRSDDTALYRVCTRCGSFAYNDEGSIGWVSMFWQGKDYKEKRIK